ncbi:MAG: Crp/Fnr family transcriptional regulator [bacterium]
METRYLKKVSFLSELSQANLKLLTRIAKKLTCKKGEEIFSISSSGQTLYIVTSGKIKIFTSSPSGKTKVLDYLERGDFFGEMSLLDQETRSASACALVDSELITINRKDFQKLLKNQPDLALSFLRVLCNRLRRADKEIEALTFQNVLGRIAIILLDFADRYGKETPEGICLDTDFTHLDLAQLAGTAREMITRIITRFKKTGCIQLNEQTKRVTIIDRDKLKSFIY